MDNNWETFWLEQVIYPPLNQSWLIEWREFHDCLRSKVTMVTEIQDGRPQLPHSSYNQLKWTITEKIFDLNKWLRYLSPLNQGWLIDWREFHDCLRSRVPEIQDGCPQQPHSSYNQLKWTITEKLFDLNKWLSGLSPLNQGWLIEWTGFHDYLRSRLGSLG